MTYHVYLLNYKHTQIDSYLKQIIYLYYEIDNDMRAVKTIESNMSNKNELEHYYRKIEANATLLRYYIRRFPVCNDSKKDFVQITNSLSHSPEAKEDYYKFGDEFKKFCKNLEDAKELETNIDKFMQFFIN